MTSDQDTMQIWALMVMIMGSSLHRSRFLNGMIRVAEVSLVESFNPGIAKIQTHLFDHAYRKAFNVGGAMPMSIPLKPGGMY